MTGYLQIQKKKKKKNILDTMWKCENDWIPNLPNQELLMFYHIQILKCLHHIPDERMKQISELELKGKILCFPRFWSHSNLHSSQLIKFCFLNPSYHMTPLRLFTCCSLMPRVSSFRFSSAQTSLRTSLVLSGHSVILWLWSF